MPYTLKDRQDYLGTRMKEVNSETMTYRRPESATTSEVTLPIEASFLGTRTFEEIVGEVVVQRYLIQQFGIDNDAAFIAAFTKPAAGDRLESAGGDKYELQPFNDETYVPTTQSRKRYLLNTKKLG